MKAGERIIVITPGGGGYGEPGKEKQIQRRKDHEESWKKGSLAERIATQESSI
jgi:5-oxoprolinase (ATP-hydrolysing)